VRIAVVAPAWFTVPPTGYGGIEVVVSLVADGLAARGHDVTLFAGGGSRSAARIISPVEQPPELAEPDAIHLEMVHGLEAYRRADEFDVIHDHSPSVSRWRAGSEPGRRWSTRCTARGPNRSAANSRT
jgi:glycosyltransferase involved in cell wall biosynthesis